MYEYECYKCGHKVYSEAPRHMLTPYALICPNCSGGEIYYSLRQIKELPRIMKPEAISELELVLRETSKNYPDSRATRILRHWNCLVNILER